MSILFVPTSATPFSRPKSLPARSPSRPTHLTRAVPTATTRSPWPVSRLLSTALFFSPLGRILRGPAPRPVPAPATAMPEPTAVGVATTLVIGAAGKTGAMVVRVLLQRSRRVRAIVRSRQRLEAALLELGVDVAAAVEADLLDVMEVDMTKLPTGAFVDVVAVANCAGTTTAPNVDADGNPLVPPVKLGSPPRYVEYSGANRVAVLAARHFDVATEYGPSVIDFSDRDAIKAEWGALDDVVMGGVSSSRVSARDIGLVYSGVVSTDNNGGFASARSVNRDEPYALAQFDGVVARVRGDGQNYKLIARAERDWDGVAYCHTFETVAGEWVDVRVPFSAFRPVRRGKTVDGAPPLDPAKIVAWQLMLSKFEYDGDLNPSFRPGAFELNVESICGYRAATPAPAAAGADGAAVGPKLVHLSSSAVTRPLREELKGTPLEVNIVRLNDTVGGLLNWKLAGEDRVRVSGVPYTVVRPCGLRSEEGKGVEQLTVGQGDQLSGLTMRDDVAEYIVSAFERPELVGKTVEIVGTAEGKSLDGSLKERLEKLAKDSDMERTFAPFPYVPLDK